MVLFAFVAISISCTKEVETGEVSRQTDFPTFTVNGAGVIFQELGTPFVEPGVSATESGQDITVDLGVSGNYRGGSSLDVAVSDQYSLSYSAVNKDGFSGAVSREVYVAAKGDLVSSIEGIYTATVLREGSGGAQYTNMEYVFIWKNTDGTYEMSDALGGYYNIGRAYGVGYHVSGAKITAVDISTNNFTYTDGAIPLFGSPFTVSNMVVDPTGKTISFDSRTTDFANGNFEVVLTQVQF